YFLADPWDDLDASHGESKYGICRQGPNGPVPAIRAMWLKAGITDHRYANTLEAAIKAAQNNPAKKQIVAKAKEFVKNLKDEIPVDLRKLAVKKVDAKAAGADLGGALLDSKNL